MQSAVGKKHQPKKKAKVQCFRQQKVEKVTSEKMQVAVLNEDALGASKPQPSKEAARPAVKKVCVILFYCVTFC